MSLTAWLAGVLLGTGRWSLEKLGVNELTETSQLDAVWQESRQHPVFLFKHSTACPISASAYRRVAEYLNAPGGPAPALHLVKVIESRPVSNAIADTLGVQHQSPQIILVHHGRAVWHAAHGGVNGAAMADARGRHT